MVIWTILQQESCRGCATPYADLRRRGVPVPSQVRVLVSWVRRGCVPAGVILV